ncbi:DUF2188 domain-containing protein [Pseudalkalibacillus sp. R45]|uniref:DUF2188 domain-containing protein n=1 Tax=Pseudalkalibacillus sp. R45 TaxID=3457433 RepID=UPI003FCC9C59
MGDKIYHILPNEDNNRWEIKVEGRDRPEKTFDTKETAYQEAQDLADASRPSQVVIHRQNGEVEDVSKYSTNG